MRYKSNIYGQIELSTRCCLDNAKTKCSLLNRRDNENPADMIMSNVGGDLARARPRLLTTAIAHHPVTVYWFR